MALPVLSSLSGTLSPIITGEGIYEGSYIIVSDPLQDAILEVAGKTMGKDITVKKIPTSEVINSGGGTTFTIG